MSHADLSRFRPHGRPALVGASVSHVNGLAGSLACLVSKENDDRRYVLSAAHVLAPAGRAAIGDVIVEPANGHGTPSPFGTLVDFEPLRGDGERNDMDAALAQVSAAADVSPVIPLIGPLRAAVAEVRLYQSVRKYGASTQHTVGVITEVARDDHYSYEGEEFLFADVFKVTGARRPFSAGGDSGALVVDALSGACVGMIIGGNEDATLVTPIARILDRFRVRIVGSV